jgi:hypothetical protein
MDKLPDRPTAVGTISATVLALNHETAEALHRERILRKRNPYSEPRQVRRKLGGWPGAIALRDANRN